MLDYGSAQSTLAESNDDAALAIPCAAVVGQDNKQRRWFVFEPALVLPEYLVELEYITTKGKVDRDPSPAQLREVKPPETARQIIRTPP